MQTNRSKCKSKIRMREIYKCMILIKIFDNHKAQRDGDDDDDGDYRRILFYF